MNPVTFPESNFRYTRPSNMTHEECGDLDVWKGKDDNDYPRIVSKWMPSEEELKKLNAGEGIYLDMMAITQCPVSLIVGSPFTPQNSVEDMAAPAKEQPKSVESVVKDIAKPANSPKIDGDRPVG